MLKWNYRQGFFFSILVFVSYISLLLSIDREGGQVSELKKHTQKIYGFASRRKAIPLLAIKLFILTWFISPSHSNTHTNISRVFARINFWKQTQDVHAKRKKMKIVLIQNKSCNEFHFADLIGLIRSYFLSISIHNFFYTFEYFFIHLKILLYIFLIFFQHLIRHKKY
jgi:hypothetical protein